VKLTIQLKAGKLPGTTDYVITAHEPQHHVFTVFGDTAGSYTTGIFRMGVSYQNASVFGIRDNLNTVLLSSKNSHSALLSYSVPVNRYDTRIGVNVNYNWLKIPPEKLANRGGTGLQIKGNSMSYGLTVTQPYYVSTKLKAQASLTIQHQTSKTKASGFTFVNDRETSETLATDITRYFSQQAIYVKPSFTHANYNGLDQSFGYNRFNLTAMWQYQTKKNWVFSATLSAQKALGNKMIPSSDQFYLGGMYSVRGYKESVIGGDSGELLNLEARIPIFRPFDRQLTAIVFADGGHVSGDTALSTKSIYGAGVGLTWELPWLKNSNMTFMVGHPFKNKIQDEKIDSYRMYFAINGRF
jgi:hemolysin activation/secretion protein